ncbi:TGBp3 [Drakaea virus A]|uniref:TGBp3 n=1 Tax=Drakaea virus A TaxID=1647805 RepID=A0A0F7KLQ0_9VIRU|nr:TGBp3 [Drakaea virus A]AKH39762.1 TGBp3 [Drakaea virus A]
MEEVPVIQHSLNCSCQSCSWSPSRSYRASAVTAVAKNVSTVPKLSHYLMIFLVAFSGSLMTVLLLYVCGIFDKHCDASYSYYYQDLNSVEFKSVPGNPIDPETVKAIHHFQKFPFGLSPMFSMFISIFQSLSVPGFIMILCVCLFKIAH